MTININKICLEASNDLSLHDYIHIDLILKLFKSLILGPFFSSLSTPLLSKLILLYCFNFILFCFLNSIILGLDDCCMLILALKNTINNNIL